MNDHIREIIKQWFEDLDVGTEFTAYNVFEYVNKNVSKRYYLSHALSAGYYIKEFGDRVTYENRYVSKYKQAINIYKKVS